MFCKKLLSVDESTSSLRTLADVPPFIFGTGASLTASGLPRAVNGLPRAISGFP